MGSRMLIIWGFKRYVSTLAMLTLVCSRCSQPSAHPLRKLITKFTLFWIPLFPTSTKYTLQCTYCGFAQHIPKDEAERLVAQQGQYAGGQYAGGQQPGQGQISPARPYGNQQPYGQQRQDGNQQHPGQLPPA